MSLYFLDSSALVKRYMTENGTNWVRSLVIPSSGNRIIISQITSIELVSTFARKQRETNISERTLKAAMLLLERHLIREYIVVRLTSEVEQQAKNLLTSHTLRAADSIQLASAQIIQMQLNASRAGSITFICADSRLRSAASQEGLATDDPGQYL